MRDLAHEKLDASMLIKSCLSMIKLITLVMHAHGPHNTQQQRYAKYQ
jgi:hypothetical protein